MAFCFSNLQKHDNAIICYKYIIQIAWTVKLREMEFSAYKGLASAYIHLGKVEKVKFYDARVTLGVYESDSTQTYKITVSQCLTAHPWLKETANAKMAAKGRLVGLALAWKQANDVEKSGTHL